MTQSLAHSGYTRNYGVFAIPRHQKVQSEWHIKSIIRSIQTHGAMSVIQTRPSTKHSGKLEVWDGQNILSACKILNIPVYYAVWNFNNKGE